MATLVGMASAQTRMPTCYRHPDRETGLSCSECGRPICTDCMTAGPVGLRCPDHATVRPRRSGAPVRPGARLSAPRIVPRARKIGTIDAPVTRVLIGVNVLIYLITVVQGNGINSPGGPLLDKFLLFGPYVQNGDWWRLITSAFLHASILHIGFNMLALWWFGRPVEEYLGSARFICLYLVSGLAGSAGALVLTPLSPTVGASGAIFGVLGAMMILEWQLTGTLAGQAMGLIAINLVLSFAIAGISIGGHIGGLIGGILCMLAFTSTGKGRAAYGRLGLTAALGVVLVAAASVAIAYWKVRGLA